MPLTAMEAQSCGVPVVSFDVGGLPDIVIHGETGLLAPSGSTEDLAGAISRLIGDTSLRERYSNAAVGHARDTWAPEVVAAKYADLYAKVIG